MGEGTKVGEGTKGMNPTRGEPRLESGSDVIEGLRMNEGEASGQLGR